MNSRLASLQPYPFQRLAQLIQGISPPADKPAIRLSMGEPQHAAPQMVLEAMTSALSGLSNYPVTLGTTELRQSIAQWATQRFQLNKVKLLPERHVLPVSGTREALFAIAQTVIDRRVNSQRPSVIMPNPFYQIYEGAALLAGARPHYLNTSEATGWRMDFRTVPEEIWNKVPLVYICTPGNPAGAVQTREELIHLIELAQQYNFVIASDECYSEIYFDEQSPPVGLLQVANELGIRDYKHCIVFHSLSKRSNLPGLRSGFVAGDGELMQQFHQYRTYQGCALPPPTQAASQLAWNDESHVRANRDQYRAKFDAVLHILSPVLDVKKPDAGFYLWPKLPQNDEIFARQLYASENVLVLPGSYLSRDFEGINPGQNRARLALVAALPECIEAAHRIRNYVESIA